MIDYFLKFTDLATAKADPTVQNYRNVIADLWNDDRVLTNITAKRISTGLPIAGWLCIVSLPGQVSVLLNHSALQFALDRDARNAGQPFVVKNNIGAVITDVVVSPVFAGSTYPVGGFS